MTVPIYHPVFDLVVGTGGGGTVTVGVSPAALSAGLALKADKTALAVTDAQVAALTASKADKTALAATDVRVAALENNPPQTVITDSRPLEFEATVSFTHEHGGVNDGVVYAGFLPVMLNGVEVLLPFVNPAGAKAVPVTKGV
jgi:hypothetical protein